MLLPHSSLTSTAASEIYRHVELLEKGGVVAQETRGFDEDRMVTYKLRSKEDAPDYRYMPDSNLPPILLSEVWILTAIAFSKLMVKK